MSSCIKRRSNNTNNLPPSNGHTGNTRLTTPQKTENPAKIERNESNTLVSPLASAPVPASPETIARTAPADPTASATPNAAAPAMI